MRRYGTPKRRRATILPHFAIFADKLDFSQAARYVADFAGPPGPPD